ncbi:MAG: alpha/beta hydrolase [Spirochaetales bacterium]|nr:alpha/beta hydrolase [Spirochaetales bacterium]
MGEKVKRNLILLCIGLCVILCSSFFASMIQSAGFTVKVYDLRNQTNSGSVEIDGKKATVSGKVVSGILFVPKAASETNKRPAVVLTHGYLNNRELQLQNAIELARRGFVVLTIDREGHGNYPNSGSQNAMMATAGLYDSAKYVYNLPYVDQTKIGISGHSMGGMTTASVLSSDNGATFDANGKATGNGLHIIKAGLMQGWSSFMGAGADVSVGNLKANDDEFFYGSQDYQNNRTIARQYLISKAAASFVGAQFDGPINVVNDGIYINGVLTEVKEGTAAPAPFRVVYENNEIHPLNHFSRKSAKDVVNFFYTAFGTPSGAKYIKSSSQTWWIKEAFSFIGLIAIFFCIFPAAGLLLELPLFKSLQRDESLPLAKREVKGIYGWIMYLCPAIICTLFSGFSIQKMNSIGGTWFPKTNLYPQDTTGWVSMWAVVCGLFALGVILVFWLIDYIVKKARKKDEYVVNPFEVGYMKGGLLGFIKTAFLGTIIVAGMYLVLFITWGIFKVDFRIWTLDMKVFNIPAMLPTMLRYTQIFAIFYLINGFTNQSYSAKNLPEWLTIAINAFFNVAGIFLVMMIQYGTFKSTGVLWQGGMALGYIVLFPIVPILIVAAIISRNLYKKTGTVWLGAFINALLFTIMTVANTASSLSYVLG